MAFAAHIPGHEHANEHAPAQAAPAPKPSLIHDYSSSAAKEAGKETVKYVAQNQDTMQVVNSAEAQVEQKYNQAEAQAEQRYDQTKAEAQVCFCFNLTFEFQLPWHSILNEILIPLCILRGCGRSCLDASALSSENIDNGGCSTNVRFIYLC